MMTFPLHLMPLLFLAQTGMSDDERNEAFNAGARWASAGVSAKCMLEMVSEGERHLLRTPVGREAASYRAQMLAGLELKGLRLSDKYYRLIKSDEETYIDYYKNGIMPEEEYNETVVEPAQFYEDLVASTADTMIQYKECNFFRGRESSETVRRAMELIQRRME